jgi:hypothetical protein
MAEGCSAREQKTHSTLLFWLAASIDANRAQFPQVIMTWIELAILD